MPASSVPGERASKTQPIPTKPAPFDIQGARDEDLIDLTPEIHKEAIDIATAYDRGGLYTPPSRARHDRGARQCRRRELVGCRDRSGNRHALCRDAAPADASFTFASPSRGKAPTISSAFRSYLPGPRGLPLLKPPFGSIVAIDMNTGEHRWRIPVGRSVAMPSIQQARHPRATGIAVPQLGAGDQDGHDRRADGILQPAALRARAQSADTGPLQSRPASVGLRQDRAAKCWRRWNCRPTRPARR